MTTHFFIYRLSFLSLFVAFIFRLFKCDVSYLQEPCSFKKFPFCCVLNLFNIQRVDYSKLTKIIASEHYDNNFKFEELLFSKIFPDNAYFAWFSNIFFSGNVDNFKIKIAHREIIERLLGDIYHVYLWLMYMNLRSSSLYAFIPNTFFSREVIKSFSFSVYNLYPPYFFYLKIALDNIFLTIKRIFSSFFSKAKRCTQDVILLNSRPVSDYKIIYFPHQGIFFGNLYLKDQFYSDDINSPFYPASILHVEHSNLSTDDSKLTLEYFNEHQIQYCRLSSLGKGYGLAQIFALFRNFTLKMYAGWELLSKTDRAYFFAKSFISFCFLYKFKYACFCFSKFTSAKIALVGYDYLFPVSYAIALQSLSITTLSVQERYIQAYYKFSKMVFDYYFVSSSHNITAINALQSTSISNSIPIGMIRTDTLLACKKFNSKFRHYGNNSHKNILVLDYHSYINYEDHCKDFAQNWAANRAFYRDIIQIAVRFPHFQFIIRGKNAEWTLIPEFSDLFHIIKDIPNISINIDYSTVNISYELASECDMVIAKHTSLGDECLSSGLPVIFHDYTHNSSEIVSVVYDYEKLPFFAHNFEELLALVSSFDNGTYPFDKQTMSFIQSFFYDNLSDGKVKIRLHQYLQKIYNEIVVGC